MDTLQALLPKNLYHSYVIETNQSNVAENLLAVLEARGEISHLSPDVLCETRDSFTIADTFLIKEWHTSKNSTSAKKICIISTKFIQQEAQHALLKILEEPQEGTHFFLILPRASSLLDTIRSRVHRLEVLENTPDSTVRAQKFLKETPNMRLKIIEEFIEAHKNADNSGALRHEAINFLIEIEKELYNSFQKNKNNPEIRFIFSELEKGREYLSIPGASVKMILEYVALVI